MSNISRTSIKGITVKTKTDTGLCGKLTVWIFKDGCIRIEQQFLVEPDYQLSDIDICVRNSKKYKLILRALMLTNTSVHHAIKMMTDLNNWWIDKIKE